MRTLINGDHGDQNQDQFLSQEVTSRECSIMTRLTILHVVAAVSCRAPLSTIEECLIGSEGSTTDMGHSTDHRTDICTTAVCSQQVHRTVATVIVLYCTTDTINVSYIVYCTLTAICSCVFAESQDEHCRPPLLCLGRCCPVEYCMIDREITGAVSLWSG